MALDTLRRTLSEPNCRIFYGGSLLAWTGMWMQRVAVGWIAWELTGSTFWIGVVAFADLFPAVVVSPIAGAMADRVDRLKLTIATQLAAIAQAIVLGTLAAAGLLNIWLLVALELALGTAQSFAQPARQSMIPALVPRALLASAVALNSLTFNLARVIGPAVAGVLIVAIGPVPTVIANALAYTAATASLLLLRLDPRERVGHAPTRSLWAETAEGFRYAAKHPGIGRLFLYAGLLGVLVRPFQELLPGFADQAFGRGADGLALLTGAVGAGALAMGLLGAGRAELAGLSRQAIAGGAAMVMCVLGFALTESFALALAACVAAGAAMVSHGVAVQTLVQSGAEGHVRGRMMALWGLIVRACPAVGAVILGTVAEWTGLRLPTIVGCIVAIAVAAWGATQLSVIAAALEKEPPRC
jgi:predicted MFS family arabinose efflux permease